MRHEKLLCAAYDRFFERNPELPRISADELDSALYEEIIAIFAAAPSNVYNLPIRTRIRLHRLEYQQAWIARFNELWRWGEEGVRARRVIQ